MSTDAIRRWRLEVEELETDALLARGRSARAALARRLDKLSRDLHEAELDAAREDLRKIRES